ncbi:beta-propeller fold lactonase family protein [Tessaracoccus coleopterorum]|uniref:beta-propeller fold lactonase family protein n=1 Tax=Tessaracoccus coleopterorum TaxID=2714950 RepID=UPI002F91484B
MAHAARPGDRTAHPAGVAATLPPGSGPRHAVFTDDGAALVIAGELDGRLHVARWDAATATAVPVGSFPACDCATPALAHVTCHGDSILVGCRGCSRIREHLMVGLTLTPGHTFDLPGGCPRHHALVDGWLVVALQEGHAVVALAPPGRSSAGRPFPPRPPSSPQPRSPHEHHHGRPHQVPPHPVVVINDAQRAAGLAEALVAGGLPVAEVTLRTPAALDAIAAIAGREDLLVGAGSVFNAAQARDALAAGARFLVSPGLDEDVVRFADAQGVPVVPGRSPRPRSCGPCRSG